MLLSWRDDHCNENKNLYYFSRSKRFASVKECEEEPEKQQRKEKRPP